MALPHHSLTAWQRADDLFLRVHELAGQRFPAAERFVLTSQARRAAFSIPLNIVEGFARQHPAERLQFLRISWASLAELGYCMHASRRLGYLSREEYEGVELEIRQVAAPLKGLMSQVAARVADRHPSGRNRKTTLKPTRSI
jgi:four helix bundle protein